MRAIMGDAVNGKTSARLSKKYVIARSRPKDGDVAISTAFSPGEAFLGAALNDPALQEPESDSSKFFVHNLDFFMILRKN